MSILSARTHKRARIKDLVPIRQILVEALRELKIPWPKHTNNDHRARVRRAVLAYCRRNRRAQ